MGYWDTPPTSELPDQALAACNKAVALSSNDPQLWAFLTYGALALIFKGEYASALQWAVGRARRQHPQPSILDHRASGSGLDLPGPTRKAQHMAARSLAENPASSLTFAREKLFYLKQQQQIELYRSGLEKAGIPHF